MKKSRNEKNQETAKDVKKAVKSVISYEVLVAAKNGDAEAVMKIVTHYNGTIRKMSLRDGYDENGFPIRYVDETLRKRLEIAVIVTIMTKFKIA